MIALLGFHNFALARSAARHRKTPAATADRTLGMEEEMHHKHHGLHPVRAYKGAYRRRKALTVVGTVVATLAIFSGCAAAAWALEATGSTTSTETTGTAGSAPVTIAAGNLTDALTPGGPAGTLHITVTNPSNVNSVQLSNLVVAVTGTSAGAACTAANFTVTQPSFGLFSGMGTTLTLPYVIGPTVEIDSSPTNNGVEATIAMNANAPAGCENVTVNLSETAS
jgi:hypothetical protein